VTEPINVNAAVAECVADAGDSYIIVVHKAQGERNLHVRFHGDVDILRALLPHVERILIEHSSDPTPPIH
jgi:hypothetical protein